MSFQTLVSAGASAILRGSQSLTSAAARGDQRILRAVHTTAERTITGSHNLQAAAARGDQQIIGATRTAADKTIVGSHRLQRAAERGDQWIAEKFRKLLGLFSKKAD